MKRISFVMSSVLAVCLAAGASEKIPPTILMDGQMLARSKQRIETGDAALKPALDKLIEDADKALEAGPFSVMNKTTVPPSGTKHDYTSLARYWWPDPTRPDGLPYIQRDGETNPETQGDNSDYVQLSRMTKAVETLGMAYYFTGEKRYAQKAADLLRVWFLDPATRMNPNLNFPQAIPGRVDGRKTGVLDGRKFCQALSGLSLLSGSSALTPSEQKALRAWFSEYLCWLKTNKLARDESDAHNNHGTFFDVQIMHIALFVGDTETAKQVAETAIKKRILSQIEPDGTQPYELARTRTLHYTLFNLEGLFLVARLAEHTGVDLWHAADSRLRVAFDFVAPYADPAKKWPYPTIKEAERVRLVPLLMRAAKVYNEDAYSRLIEKIPLSKRESLRENLVVPLAD